MTPREGRHEYDRDATGRITGIGGWTFNVNRAAKNWKLRCPDPTYRRFVLSEAKRRAEEAGHLYCAQCADDLLEVV